MPPSDPNLSWLHSLYQRQPALDLGPLDLCFLVALQRRAQELGVAALDEQQLLDIFAAVCSLVALWVNLEGIRKGSQESRD